MLLTAEADDIGAGMRAELQSFWSKHVAEMGEVKRENHLRHKTDTRLPLIKKEIQTLRSQFYRDVERFQIIWHLSLLSVFCFVFFVLPHVCCHVSGCSCCLCRDWADRDAGPVSRHYYTLLLKHTYSSSPGRTAVFEVFLVANSVFRMHTPKIRRKKDFFCSNTVNKCFVLNLQEMV